MTTKTKLHKRLRPLAEKHPGKTPLPVDEAVEILKQFNNTKFDQSVEIAMRLGIDPKQADQIVRGSIVLPHGIGKTLRVVVFAKGDLAEQAKRRRGRRSRRRGTGQEDQGRLDRFRRLHRRAGHDGHRRPAGKVLGPRGLMPSPRAGTVTPDIGQDGQRVQGGKVEFRNDAGGNVHAVVGKLSFDAAKLAENIQAFIHHVQNLKPHSVKGQYVKGISVSATMSPSVRIAVVSRPHTPARATTRRS